MDRQSPQDRPDKPPKQPSMLRYSGMGMELAAAVIGLTLAGYWVDLHYGTRPRGVLVGAILGLVGGFYNFIRQAIQLSRLQHSLDQKRSRKADDGNSGN